MTLVGGGLSLMTSKYLNALIIVHALQFSSLIIIQSSVEKDHLSIKKLVKNLRCEINQRLKLWTRVPIAVSSRPAAAHMFR